jgi:CHAT domain-containing protein/Tfp pilus assembly protein PilF
MKLSLGVPSSTFRQTFVVNFAILTLSISCVFATAAAQTDDAWLLAPNAPIERELAGGQKHTYRIEMSEGQYLRLVVKQRGIDMVVHLYGPDGKRVAKGDKFTSWFSLETLQWIAESSGDYRLEAMPSEKGAVGRYEIRIEVLRPATAQDRLRMAAERLQDEAMDLRGKRAAESSRQAMAKFLEAARIFQEAEDGYKAASALYDAGYTLSGLLGEPRKARDYYEQALNTFSGLQNGDYKTEIAITQGQLGWVYNAIGEKQKAIDTLRQSLAHYRAIGDRVNEAEGLDKLAFVTDSIGDKRHALDLYQQSLSISRALKDERSEASTLNNMAILYHFIGEFQKALDGYRESLEIKRRIGWKDEIPQSLTGVGLTLISLGQAKEALSWFDQALALARESGNKFGQAVVLNNMSISYIALQDNEKALEHLWQSLQLRKEAGDRAGEARTLNSIASIYNDRKDGKRALEILPQALALSQDVRDRLTQSAILNNIAFAWETLGEAGKSLDHYQQALSLSKAVMSREYQIKNLGNIAKLQVDLGNLAEARRSSEEALDLVESARTSIRGQDSRAAYFARLHSVYGIYVDTLMRMSRQQTDKGLDRAALQASERARARSLLEILAETRADIRQGVDPSLLERERQLRAQLNTNARRQTSLLSGRHTPEQAAAVAKEVEDFTLQLREIETRIRQVSPRYAALTQPQPLNSMEIQSLLDNNTVLLEFATGVKQSWMWAVTPNEVSSYQLPSHQEIRAAAKKFYGLLIARQPNNQESSTKYAERVAAADAQILVEASSLSRMLLAPVASKLNLEWKGKRLVIVASDALDYLPFAALPVPPVPEAGPKAAEGYRPLIAQHEIVNLPSASVLAAIRSESAGRRKAASMLAILADPVFDGNDPRVLMAARKKEAGGKQVASVRSAQLSSSSPASNHELMRSARSFNRDGFSQLPFSRKEADAIAALIPKDKLLKATGFKANRSTATSSELSRYRIVHFATHGLLNSEYPELSGLVLSLVDENGAAQDGFLRMHEIYNLRLPADVIVLSACQTALGKEIRGEGFVGLTRGFMYAGAERVVASLWQVDDLATAELMKRFYRGMLLNKLRPAAALRAAQLEMMKQKRWSSPFFWAGFTMQGEWR